MIIKKLYLLVIAYTVCSTAYMAAQNVTTPYSMYGYGILNDYATSKQRQMGGVGVAMQSGRQINVMNPASYADMDSLTFLFDMGADLSLMWSKEGAAREHSTGGGLDYLTMKFPICKYMGGSIGLLPYSSVGYAFGNEVRHGTTQNQGSGGINQAYFGLAGTYGGFSLGANISYSFGNIINDIYAYPASQGQSLFEHVMHIRDWNLLLGAQYNAKLNKHANLTLGFTFSPKKSLHGDSYASIQELVQESKADTLGMMKLGGHYFTPNCYAAGIAFTYSRAYRVSVEGDFSYQQWSKAPYEPLRNDAGKVLFDGMEFNDRIRAALGAEYTPRLRGNYGQRMTYRIGAYYTRDYLKIRNNAVKEYGVTCGLGLPTPEGRTEINLGFEWKHRNAYPDKLLSENYFNITLGINFNELWFWKRKIN
ncbi:MAG: hypothetical protein NC201_02040 [Prevotella sp.]|nr:hypothetical protein [Bacteroides sp.]MCM1366008.1 hypothetical protein [Prevotella sp.]MCM1436922.1 hypothetical protein [Prevotella sp.]